MPNHTIRWRLASVDEDAGARIRVEPSGELDLATVDLLDAALRAAQTLAANVRSISPADLHGLQRPLARRRGRGSARHSGKRFRIIRGPSIIDRLFTLTGIDQRLEPGQG